MEIKGVTESVVEYLRDRIVMGQFSAGRRLNERQLSTHIGVSRPPLREAFRILEHERLVESIPRKGTRVTDISVKDLQNVCQVREMIECYAIDVIEEKKMQELPLLDSALATAASLSVPSDDDPEKQLIYFKTFAEFHIKLVDSAENYWLTHFHHAIASNLARYQFMYFSIEGAAQRSVYHHGQIMVHLKGGEYREAKACLKAHLRGTAELLQSRILETTGE